MIFSETLLLNESGLFDFDFTFVIESIEFILFSLVVTFSFISPISKQLDERAEFINTTLRKSTLLLTFGYIRNYRTYTSIKINKKLFK